jgi:hypothetical protein
MSCAEPFQPIAASWSWESEVKIVTAVTKVSGNASTAALTMSWPPDAWTVKYLGESFATA